jgi:hypothetical protein
MMPDLGLGTDIGRIPGETDQQFENSRRLVEELPFPICMSSRIRTTEDSGDHRDAKCHPKAIRERVNAMQELAARKRSSPSYRSGIPLMSCSNRSTATVCKGFTGSYLRVGNRRWRCRRKHPSSVLITSVADTSARSTDFPHSSELDT